MSFKTPFFAGVAALAFALPAFADGIMIHDPYARASSGMAMSGAAFMEIVNQTDTDDRLVEARSEAAARVELHTHMEDANGVMRMMEVEDGFAIPAGQTHALARGGDHVMFMGLTEPFEHGEEIEVTLVFEQAGEITVMIPIDLERMPAMGGQMGHGAMGHGGHGNMGQASQ